MLLEVCHFSPYTVILHLLYIYSSNLPPGITTCGRDGDAMRSPQLPDEIIKIILDMYLGSCLGYTFVEFGILGLRSHRKRCLDLMVVSKRFYVSLLDGFTTSIKTYSIIDVENQPLYAFSLY